MPAAGASFVGRARISTFLNARNIVSRWLSSLATISINAVMQAIGLLIFARTLGPAEYAVIVAATTVAAIAAEFVGLGAGDLLIREVSRNAATHRSAFGRALRLVFISYVPMTLVAAAVAQFWFRTGASFVVLLLLVASEIAATRIVFMTEQIAIAHHRTHAANANRMFATAVRFGTICVAVLFAGVSTASQWAPFAVVAAAVSTIGCLAITIRRFGSPDLTAPFQSTFHIGLSFTLMQVVRAIQFSIDKLAAGWIAPGAALGSVGVASRIAQLGMLPTTAITRITYPMFFAEGASGLPAAIRLGKRIAPAVVGVGIVSTIALVGIAYILPHLIGPAFGAAKWFLILLALLPLAAGIQNVQGDVLSGSDLQTFRLAAGAFGLLISGLTTVAGGLLGGLTGALAGYMLGHFVVAGATSLMITTLRKRNA